MSNAFALLKNDFSIGCNGVKAFDIVVKSQIRILKNMSVLI